MSFGSDAVAESALLTALPACILPPNASTTTAARKITPALFEMSMSISFY
jgi:hypothetical protein